MAKDSAGKKVHSIKRLNRIMGYVLIGTAFLMTFLFIDQNIKNNYWPIVVGVFSGLIVIEAIVWIVLYFSFKKNNLTENDKKIIEAIEKINKENKDTLDERSEELYHEAAKLQQERNNSKSKKKNR